MQDKALLYKGFMKTGYESQALGTAGGSSMEECALHAGEALGLMSAIKKDRRILT